MIKSAGIAFLLICVFTVWGEGFGFFAIVVSAMIFGACLAEWIYFAINAILQNHFKRLTFQTLAFSTFVLPAYAVSLSGIQGYFTQALCWGSLACFYRMFYENTKHDRPKYTWWKSLQTSELGK